MFRFVSLVLFASLASLSTSDARRFEFTPKSSPPNTKPCVLLDIDFNITMTMTDGLREDYYYLNSEPTQKINVTGSCGPQHSSIILQFSKGTMWSFIFQSYANGTVTLKRVASITPKTIFGPMADRYSTPISFKTPAEEISEAGTSYSCNAEQKFDYLQNNVVPGNTTFTIISVESSVSAQGFNVTDGKFSPATSCNADIPTTHTIPASSIVTPNTTATTATTQTTPTTPSATPSVNEYIVKEDNTTCIVLMASMEVSIGYTANTSSGEELRTVSFPITANAKSNGTCGSKFQTLDVLFKDDWYLKFIFNTDDDKNALSSQEDTSYKLNEMYLSYTLDKTNFPNASEPGRQVTVPANKLFMTKPEGSGYYQCNSSVALVLDTNHKVVTQFLEFKAFNRDDSTGFSGSASNCFTDDHSDSMVPIIVGAVMGGLLLIILIVFIIHRYRKRNDYDGIRG